PDAVPSRGPFRPRLKHRELTWRAPFNPLDAREIAAARTLVQDPRDARPAVRLDDGMDRWRPRPDLLNSGRRDPHFVVETDEEGRSFLRFGDGILGRRPARDARYTAWYRRGNGRAGNVGAEAIAHVVGHLGGEVRIRNPLPAAGGVDPEPLERARLHAQRAFRVQERAVTEEDYARAAETFEGVRKAMATRRWTGSWCAMFVTVDRRDGLPVDDAFEARLRRHLEKYRLAGHDLEIDGPRFAPLHIAFTVWVKSEYFRRDVKTALAETFGDGRRADGRLGFFHPDNFTFGQPVYLSRIISAAMAVTGVEWVDFDPAKEAAHRFSRLGETTFEETETSVNIETGRIDMERLEIARLDNDPNARENGRIEFIMEGGS
ncbi:MAG: putative baseplate assembly protein, partial [Desulfobacterales bacterium]|nr:putative baseplate assembly protein [Desulfobacterales bacterium]